MYLRTIACVEKDNSIAGPTNPTSPDVYEPRLALLQTFEFEDISEDVSLNALRASSTTRSSKGQGLQNQVDEYEEGEGGALELRASILRRHERIRY
jgi:hypothetical protein